MSEAASLSPIYVVMINDYSVEISFPNKSKQNKLTSLPSNILTGSRKTSDDDNDDDNWFMNKQVI